MTFSLWDSPKATVKVSLVTEWFLSNSLLTQFGMLRPLESVRNSVSTTIFRKLIRTFKLCFRSLHRQSLSEVPVKLCRHLFCVDFHFTTPSAHGLNSGAARYLLFLTQGESQIGLLEFSVYESEVDLIYSYITPLSFK